MRKLKKRRENLKNVENKQRKIWRQKKNTNNSLPVNLPPLHAVHLDNDETGPK
jgi:hypothetical protein